MEAGFNKGLCGLDAGRQTIGEAAESVVCVRQRTVAPTAPAGSQMPLPLPPRRCGGSVPLGDAHQSNLLHEKEPNPGSQAQTGMQTHTRATVNGGWELGVARSPTQQANAPQGQTILRCTERSSACPPPPPTSPTPLLPPQPSTLSPSHGTHRCHSKRRRGGGGDVQQDRRGVS